MRKIPLFFTAALILLSACAPASQTAPAGNAPTTAQALVQSSDTSPFAASSTFTPQTTPSLTPLPSATLTQTPMPEPAFDPAQLGLLSELSSYAYTIQSQTLQTAGSGAIDYETTVTAITDPWRAIIVSHRTDNTAKEDYARDSQQTFFWVGDLIYLSLPAESWSISPQTKQYQFVVDPLLAMLPDLKTARFVAQESSQGFPANHFVFNLDDISPATGGGKFWKTLEGNLWLSQDGNYLLHFDYKAEGDLWQDMPGDASKDPIYSPGSQTVVYTLSSIDQVKEIPVNLDLPSQVAMEPGVPVPAEAELAYVYVQKGSPSMRYSYNVDLTGDEILAFYTGLPPNNGWTVKSTAKDPAGKGGIIILTNNGYDLLLTASYIDWAGRYSINFSYPP